MSQTFVVAFPSCLAETAPRTKLTGKNSCNDTLVRRLPLAAWALCPAWSPPVKQLTTDCAEQSTATGCVFRRQLLVDSRARGSRSRACACAPARACAFPCASACVPAVGAIRLGWTVLYSGMWARYICLRSGCGSDGCVYKAFRGLKNFWKPSGA